MPPRDLIERTRLFSHAVFRFCRNIPRTDETREPVDQLRRAANSMRLNYRAARRGRSYAEFRAKLGVVFEEADEAADCLRFLRDAGIRHDARLVQEGEELARIFAKAVQTANSSWRRRKDVPDS